MGSWIRSIGSECSTWRASTNTRKSEALESYLTALEIPLIPRKMMLKTNPTVEISKHEDEWSFTFKVALMTNNIKFELDKEFSEKEPMSGASHQSLAKMEGDKLVITAETGRGQIKRTFSFSEDGMIMEMFAVKQNVSCRRIFKREK